MHEPQRLNARNELIGFGTKLSQVANSVTDDTRLEDVDGTLREVEVGIKGWREKYLAGPKAERESKPAKTAAHERTR
jgi:hypothetical protein